MEIQKFEKNWFDESKSLRKIGDKYNSGQITIIGGSKLFHGAPLLALKGASRLVSMTFFSSPEEDKEIAEKIKAGVLSFVWVPRDDIESYIAKSDAILIGPGLMRSHIKEHDFVCDSFGEETKKITESLLKKFPNKKWVIDGGSLQVISVNSIPKGTIVTPNSKEFEMLFGEKVESDLEKRSDQVLRLANKYNLVVLIKDAISLVSDGERVVMIEGGNDGLVKGGVGDVIAGVTVGFLAMNDPLFSVAASSYLVKKAAERLAETRNIMFNSDDLVDAIPEVYAQTMNEL